MPLQPIDPLDLFSGERAALLALLRDLSPAEWAAPTVCAGWSVQDVALHLLGDDLGRLSWGRDGFVSPAFAAGLDVSTLPGLVAAIDRQNAVWVEGTRRISPRLVIELLTMTGDLTEAYFRSLDLAALGMPVDWAGPEPAPIWLDVTREYTERWVHQQHIRDAVGRPGMTDARWLGPVLAAFMYAVPRALSGVSAPDGTAVRCIISGNAGGEWMALRWGGAWVLGSTSDTTADATVTLDQDVAWRLFTKGMSREDAQERSLITGDPLLAGQIFDTVSILA
jgi:uncharacterized protein (TIGR03083 family)